MAKQQHELATARAELQGLCVCVRACILLVAWRRGICRSKLRESFLAPIPTSTLTRALAAPVCVGVSFLSSASVSSFSLLFPSHQTLTRPHIRTCARLQPPSTNRH